MVIKIGANKILTQLLMPVNLNRWAVLPGGVAGGRPGFFPAGKGKIILVDSRECPDYYGNEKWFIIKRRQKW